MSFASIFFSHHSTTTTRKFAFKLAFWQREKNLLVATSKQNLQHLPECYKIRMKPVWWLRDKLAMSKLPVIFYRTRKQIYELKRHVHKWGHKSRELAVNEKDFDARTRPETHETNLLTTVQLQKLLHKTVVTSLVRTAQQHRKWHCHSGKIDQK